MYVILLESDSAVQYNKKLNAVQVGSDSLVTRLGWYVVSVKSTVGSVILRRHLEAAAVW